MDVYANIGIGSMGIERIGWVTLLMNGFHDNGVWSIR